MKPVLGAALIALCAQQATAECGQDVVDLRGDWGQARFSVELADDPDERARGLMFREDLPQNEGMLFVYETPRRASFWMRNTLIPLDMIFADQTGLVTGVHGNAVPLDETPIDGGSNVFAVLEINGGLAETYGIAPGTQMRHPAFDQKAAVWACRVE